MMTTNPYRLMVVDHEPGCLQIVSAAAGDLGFEVAATGDIESFKADLESFEPSLVMLDLQMPRSDGVELLRFLAESQCEARIVLLGRVEKRVLDTAERLGTGLGLTVLGSLRKPLGTPQLIAVLGRCKDAIRGINANDLRQAIDNGELLLEYQPKACLKPDGDWVIEGVEALIRWNHPQHGKLLPARFLGLAEEANLIGALTDYVFCRAIEQGGAWARAGLGLTVAVNLAAPLLQDLQVPDRLATLLREQGLDGTRLLLEITETAAMADPGSVMDILTRLRLKDIGLSLDDFGTAASPLRHLYRMPFNELKIDRSLVTETDDSEEARTVITSIVNLAHNLGLSVCAEGVETADTLHFLRSVSCDKAQGYFISRPVAAARIESFVRRWNSGEPAGESDGISSLAG